MVRKSAPAYTCAQPPPGSVHASGEANVRKVPQGRPSNMLRDAPMAGLAKLRRGIATDCGRQL